MKMKQQFKMVSALLSAVLFLSFTTAKADIISLVEESAVISEGVISYTFSSNGKYIYASTLKKIYVLSRNSDTGKVVGIQTVALPTGAASFGYDNIVISPDDKQVYISLSSGLSTNNGVIQYDVDNTGSLTYHGYLPIQGGSSSCPLKISNDGKFIYAGWDRRIYIIERSSNGDIQIIGETSGSIGMEQTTRIEFGPNNDTLYSSDAYTDNLYVFNINKSNGNLAHIQTIPAGGEGIALTKDGKFFYSTKRSKETISIYSRASNGKLTPFKDVENIPFPSNTSTHNILFGTNDVVVSPNQKYVYTYASLSKNIAVWKRNIDTGDLSYLGRIENISGSSSKGEMYSSQDGKHLYLNGSGLFVFDLRSDLSLVKSGPSKDVAPNGTMTYTLAVTNKGLSDAQNVVVTDNLPAGTSFIAGTNNNTSDKCTAKGQKVTCKMGQILVNDGYNAIIQVKAPATEGKVTNTASVTSDQLDTKTANNTDSVTSTVKKGGATNPPVKGGGGGGSLPLSMLLLLIPALMRRRVELS